MRETAWLAWNGETYKGDAAEWWEKFTTDPEFLQHTEDLTEEELLRLSLFAYNGGWGLVPDDMPVFIAQEQEAFYGEYVTEAEFAEEFFISTGQYDEEANRYLVIDWQGTYDYSLRYDFFHYDAIDQDGAFHRFFWNANV